MASPTEPENSNANNQTNIASPSRRERLTKRLTLWFVFSIFMGSLPVILNILILIRDGTPIQFFNLFARGELLIITVAIATSSISDLLNGNKFGNNKSLIAFCFSFIILVISACLFSSLGIDNKASNTLWFGIISLFLYVAATSVGAWCQILGEA